MRGGHKPNTPSCTLGRFIPEQMDVEEVKAAGWNDHGILVVAVNDSRIGWIERQIIEQLGNRIYGRRKK